MKVYIAFSITGTNAFITATKEVATIDPVFRIIPSRMSASEKARKGDPADSVKLSWNKLMTAEGKPFRSAPMVLNRFKMLEAAGWKVDKAKFVATHFKGAFKRNSNRG